MDALPASLGLLAGFALGCVAPPLAVVFAALPVAALGLSAALPVAAVGLSAVLGCLLKNWHSLGLQVLV